jgi:uncharacterized protein YdhG (YjbR/CyaY superfamily)
MATKTTKAAAKTASKRTVDDYLAAAPKDKRDVLMRLRKTVKAAAPKATESVSYGLAGYKYNGKPLVYFAYWRDHCSVYGFTGSVIDAHAAELKPYDISKGTIKFTAEKPLGDRLMTKMVKDRIAEIEEAG